MDEERVSPREWTTADSALWHTLVILADRRARRMPKQRAKVDFPLAEGEIALATGPFDMDVLLGDDGAPVEDPKLVFGARALGADDVPGAEPEPAADRQDLPDTAWHHDFSGELTVTSHGFYLQTGEGRFRWLWQDVSQAEVSAFTALMLQGQSESGTITWRLRSSWAELVFVLWVMAANPGHPQLATGSWLPDHWVEWAAAMGYPLPEEAAALVA